MKIAPGRLFITIWPVVIAVSVVAIGNHRDILQGQALGDEVNAMETRDAQLTSEGDEVKNPLANGTEKNPIGRGEVRFGRELSYGHSFHSSYSRNECCFEGYCRKPGEWLSSDSTGYTCRCDSTGNWASCYQETRKPTPHPTKRPTPHPTRRPCYWCPANSRKKAGYDYECTNTFDDCECDYGYKKSFGNTCQYCDYQCPQYSDRRYDVDCYRSFDDCECDIGYHKVGYQCVKKPTPRPTPRPTKRPTPKPTTKPCYWCPVNSYKKSGYYVCNNTFDDCECEYGYKKWNDNTCKFCNYQCPEYSSPKHGLDCYESFDDCKCLQGYKKVGYKCVPKPTPRPTPHPTKRPTPYPTRKPCYWCPVNSHKKSGYYVCNNTFDDCECDYGYYKFGYQCLKLTPSPTKRPTPHPTKSCYYCPDHSSLKSNSYCKNSFDDCECDYGYSKYGNKCCYECPQNSYPKYGLQCIESFDSCECNTGYNKSWNSRRGHFCTRRRTYYNNNYW